MSSINPRENMSVLYYYYALLEKSISSKIEGFKNIVRFVRNWHEVVLFRLGFINSVEIVFRNGRRYYIGNADEYRRIFREFLYEYYAEVFRKDGG